MRSGRPVIRSMHFDDLDQIVDLHATSFGHRDNPIDDIRAFYENVFTRCLGPSCAPHGDQVPSLVAEQHGRIVGMVLGARVAAQFDGQTITGVAASLFATRPGHTSPSMSRRMVEEICARSGSFTYSDRVNPDGRRVAERGGLTFYPQHSLRWALVLAPARAAAAGILNRRTQSGKLVASVMQNTARVTDKILREPVQRIQRTQRTRAVIGSLTTRALTPDDLVQHASAVLVDYRLTPDLSSPEVIASSWRWLEILRPEGRHQRTGVWTADGRLVGWFLLHIWPTGIAEVVQLMCTPKAAARVIAVLMREAERLGVASLHGSLPPQLLLPLGEAGAHFAARNSAVGIYSPNPELHDAFAAGTAFLSGLEGEYPMQLAPGQNHK